MSYFIPDLSAKNPAYHVPNLKKRVVASGQTLEFFTPVFADSIQLVMEGTVPTPMVRGIDWTISASDYDYDSMGKAQILNKEFDQKLVKSVTITMPFVDAYTVNCSYQQLYPNIVQYILQNPTENQEITPEVIWNLLNDVANLKLATAPISDVKAKAERTPVLLPPDPNKIYPQTNLVDGEVWQVDTPNGKKVVFPVAGSFYRDSVKVVRGKVTSVDEYVGDPDKYFVENKDYIITGPDAYGIKHTSNKSGVYRLIIFLTAYVGDVTVQYHAYGGEPTQYDIRAVSESLTNLYEYITSAQIPTANSIGNFPVMQEFRARLAALEENMRKFANDGKPSYGDVTNGQCLLKKITASDTELHWWTIAELYQVAGSATVFVADMAHLQIQTKYTKMLLDLNIAVNLEHPGKKLNVTVQNSLLSQGFVPFKSNVDLNKLLRPQLRIVYNENTIQGSGIYLQLGLRLRGVAEETIAVSDLSGTESCWKLIASPTDATNPEDDNILLPSGNHMWSTANADSRSESQLVPLQDAHVCWAGDEPLNRQSSGWKSTSLVHFLEKDIDISKLKTVKLMLEESESNRFTLELPLCGDDNSMTGISTAVYANKPLQMVFNIARHPVSKELTMTLDSEIGAGIQSNRLGLRYVMVNT